MSGNPSPLSLKYSCISELIYLPSQISSDFFNSSLVLWSVKSAHMIHIPQAIQAHTELSPPSTNRTFQDHPGQHNSLHSKAFLPEQGKRTAGIRNNVAGAFRSLARISAYMAAKALAANAAANIPSDHCMLIRYTPQQSSPPAEAGTRSPGRSLNIMQNPHTSDKSGNKLNHYRFHTQPPMIHIEAMNPPASAPAHRRDSRKRIVPAIVSPTSISFYRVGVIAIPGINSMISPMMILSA